MVARVFYARVALRKQMVSNGNGARGKPANALLVTPWWRTVT